MEQGSKRPLLWVHPWECNSLMSRLVLLTCPVIVTVIAVNGALLQHLFRSGWSTPHVHFSLTVFIVCLEHVWLLEVSYVALYPSLWDWRLCRKHTFIRTYSKTLYSTHPPSTLCMWVFRASELTLSLPHPLIVLPMKSPAYSTLPMFSFLLSPCQWKLPWVWASPTP